MEGRRDKTLDHGFPIFFNPQPHIPWGGENPLELDNHAMLNQLQSLTS